MNTGPFDIGDRVLLDGAFTDLDGVPEDPTEVTLRIRRPDATVAVIHEADLTNPTVGTWEGSVTIDQSGWWWYRFEGTGAVTAAEEKRFRVRVRRVPAGS